MIAILLFLGVSTHVSALGGGAGIDGTQPRSAAGILQSIENANVTHVGEDLLVTQKDAHTPVEMVFTRCQGLGVQYEENQWWVLPITATGVLVDANRALWILPLDAMSKDHSWHIKLNSGDLSAKKTETGLTVTLHAKSVTLSMAEARPHSDPFGHRFSLEMAGGAELEEALAAFYWGTILPSVVEKTMAADFPYHSGYVLSTLNVSSYAGSYPAVDHEFQIKGRLAMGSEADLDVVRRMIELQFKLINDDPEALYRMPTSVQPDGRREYHVRRNSLDNRQNAAMFPVTGNIEVIEEAWRYYEARKDAAWLRANIGNLEHAAGWILSNTDQYGRVWSDVYYEDQVIKDGRVTQAQAFAARAFVLLAGMERLLERRYEAARFGEAAKKMADVLVTPLPMGYWDAKNERFIDWVDRDGKAHDHIHLLANELPVVFGYATAEQAGQVRRLIDMNAEEFERFPTFVAAKIADYDKAEIGSGGPYDLCAAGRYWYWDAAFREAQQQNGVLLDQLKKVAAEGAKNSYFMSERYDMDHVYYIDGKDAHGAEKYYEYPNVFAAVLIEKLLGLAVPADADVSVAPHLTSYGSVEFGIPEYALRYSYSQDGFVLKNLSDRPRRYKVDLSALAFAATHYQLSSKSLSEVVGARSTLTLSAQEEARWTPVR
ncbi:hypothetical protein [Acidobacterium sp. S8]|uniref:hypothetical protein n=1 Tax=Acidobacterium sp. S8 TaxID=1641854 RepID=UPI00131A7ADE|nr:hypothetical protein [Acidobacterium sp. S8]